MLSRDELVLHLFGAFLRGRENLRQPRTEVLLPALDPRKARDRGFAVILNDLDIGPQLSEQRPNDSLRLLEHRAKDMFRLDLLVLITLSQFNARLNRFLSAKCEFI